jgi:hypothetical protein
MKRHWAAALAAGALAFAGAMPTALAASLPGGPSQGVVTRVAHSYHEAGVKGETYAASFSTTVQSGVAYAVQATRSPTADGYGQIILFFYEDHFVGLNSPFEAAAIQSVKARGEGVFAVTYANYKKTDPLYKPSLKPVTILYHVGPQRVSASMPLPSTVHDDMGKAVRWNAASYDAIVKVMAAFHEVGVSGETYHPIGAIHTTPGAGSNIATAAVGVRWPTADGYGQIVFFFEGRQFVGLASSDEATAVLKVVPAGANAFRVTYANYKSSDPLVDPSLPPVTITYRLTSSGVSPSASLPAGVKNKLRASR